MLRAEKRRIPKVYESFLSKWYSFACTFNTKKRRSVVSILFMTHA